MIIYSLDFVALTIVLSIFYNSTEPFDHIMYCIKNVCRRSGLLKLNMNLGFPAHECQIIITVIFVTQ